MFLVKKPRTLADMLREDLKNKTEELVAMDARIQASENQLPFAVGMVKILLRSQKKKKEETVAE